MTNARKLECFFSETYSDALLGIAGEKVHEAQRGTLKRENRYRQDMPSTVKERKGTMAKKADYLRQSRAVSFDELCQPSQNLDLCFLNLVHKAGICVVQFYQGLWLHVDSGSRS